MSKSLTASKQVMQNYLSELLTEEVTEPSKVADQHLEKLLEQVSSKKPPAISTKRSSDIKPPKVIEQAPVVEPPLVTEKSRGALKVAAQRSYRQGSFQAMFFDVAGLTIAVPLIELGGIHNNEKSTPLMGKPPWFKGVMVHREENINVVDTALWVMPEKCDQNLKDSLNYQYIIMLSDSPWGLSAEQLVDTVTLQQDDVKWLDEPSKRPWLAGLVKDRKCALLDVESLIQLLNAGASVTGD